jgi:hypothetical protein
LLTGRVFSELQDIACNECDAVLGIKCLNTPVNHVLDEWEPPKIELLLDEQVKLTV